MNLRKALTPDAICLDLKSRDKAGLIEEMIDLLVKTGMVPDRDNALRAINERERKMSTGMQNGIAIPHAKCDVVDGLVAAFGVVKEGVDFNSLDGKPAQIIIMTLSPTKRAGPHIQFLAEISRVLNNPDTREKVLSAESPDAVLHLLAT